MNTTDKVIIGFGHRAQVGKDTAGDYLAKVYQYKKMAFASALKQAAQTIFNLTPKHMEPPLKEQLITEWGMSPREILQKFGTDAMRRTFGDDIWVKTVKHQLPYITQNVVITDVRFHSEADAIKNWGGYVVRIDRSVEGTKNSTHQSEIDLLDYDKWDYVIDNNGTFEQLYDQLDKLIAYTSHNNAKN